MAIKVGMVSLGCPKNQVDAETMLYTLAQKGYEITNKEREADVVVINTCGFIEKAKQEAIDTILEFCDLKDKGIIKSVVVTGCLAQRYADEIKKEIPEVDAVVGLAADAQIAEMIEKTFSGRGEVTVPHFDRLSITGPRLVSTPSHYAYLKIAEGCDNRCTYCAIPMIRGRFVSRPMEDLVSEAKTLAGQGVRELILVAQDTTQYGEDLYGEKKLSELIGKLSAIEDLRWIRLLYCYPERITEELVRVIAENEKVVKYLDIPIQHISDAVLKRMNRRTSKAQIMDLIKMLRDRIPNIELRTTLLTGFPGEMESDFEELVEWIRSSEFEKLGCFAYSPEEGTPAAVMDGQIDEELKQKRADMIMQEQLFVSDRVNRNKIGKTCDAVVEGKDRRGYYGRTEWDAPEIDFTVRIKGDKTYRAGDFVRVRITGADETGLCAQVLCE